MSSENTVNKRIHIISLGCPKNLVDSEFILGFLTRRGYTVTDRPEEAGALLVNTCAFIEAAVEESIDAILDLVRFKETGSAWALVVAGCLTERYREELAALLPEVDLFYGTGGLNRLPDFLDDLALGHKIETMPLARPGFIPKNKALRLRSAPFFQAYLKIAEGCSNACSYCLIPRLRGPYRSRPFRDVLDEAAVLVREGVREVTLVAQDTTAYGLDLNPPADLAALLAGLTGIDGLGWLRVMYAYPRGITDHLIEVMSREPKICAYLDLPLQHSSPSVLKKMGRGRMIPPSDLVTWLRREIPALSLRTTLMVGFPGESDEDFEDLMEFVARSRFEHLGVFAFSPEEGAGAAALPGQVAEEIKRERRERIMLLQKSISREHNRAMMDKVIPVLVEGYSPETELLLVGRSRGQAPDIDGQVLINKGTAAPGEITPVLITEAFDYDLVGEIVDRSTRPVLT